MTPSEFRAARAPRSEFFRGLKEQDIDDIIRAARPVRVEAGTILIMVGNKPEYCYLLWKGRCRYFYETVNGKKLICMWRVPGHVIGGAAISPFASVTLLNLEAVQDSVLLAWDVRTIRTLVKRFPLLLENALGIAINEFAAWYVAAHAALASQTAQERLANLIVQLCPLIGTEVDDGTELDMINEELSDCTVLTVFTVSRIMAAWEKIGIVSRRRSKVIVHFPDKLFAEIPSLKSIRLLGKR